MWTSKEQDLLERFDTAFPAPKDDDACRLWAKRLAEQFAYTFPAAGWGTKSAGGGRPASTDVICTRVPFVGYDVLVSQGTSHQSLAKYPEGLNLAGQTYITVFPANHLGGGTVPVPVPVPVPPIVQPYPDEPLWWGGVFTSAIVAAYTAADRVFPDSNQTPEGIRATLDGFRWWSRCAYKIRDGMTKETALADTVREVREQLGRTR